VCKVTKPLRRASDFYNVLSIGTTYRYNTLTWFYVRFFFVVQMISHIIDMEEFQNSDNLLRYHYLSPGKTKYTIIPIICSCAPPVPTHRYTFTRWIYVYACVRQNLQCKHRSWVFDFTYTEGLSQTFIEDYQNLQECQNESS